MAQLTSRSLPEVPMDTGLSQHRPSSPTDPTSSLADAGSASRATRLREAATGSGAGAAVRLAILIVAIGFFFAPWIAAAIFGFTRPEVGFTTAPVTEALTSTKGVEAITNTALITGATTVAMLLLLVPTVVFVNLAAPKLASVIEVISVIPLVVPAVALVSGATEFYRAVSPGFINSLWSLVPLYVILVMPLCYRALDAGVKTLHLPTLFAASSSMGATGWGTLFRVILPNLKVSMLSAALLCVAMCLSEFATASLLLHFTFPVYLVEISSTNPRGIAALSFITTMITWLLLATISWVSRSESRTAHSKESHHG